MPLVVLLCGALVLYPIGFLIAESLNTGDPSVFPPEEFGLDNYTNLIDDVHVLANTALVSCIATVLAVLFGFLQASLGLQIDHAAGEIRLNRPTLPGFLDHLDLRGVRLGEASVDLRIHRYGDDVAVTVTGRNGELRVVAVH